ncbi:hypothetical protein LJR039_003090 [Pseudorhodoferax sp. LjRoot39]|uniref:hypothetical protein n=1 Tax=Pseudorhodoferax sp. LjRoot39 TaxID=3342328 RepID=UPI003ED05AF5
MHLFFATLPLALFLLLRVALVDPRTPMEPAGILGMVISVLLGTLPIVFIHAPESPIFNICLVFALSVVITPVLFGAMKTDTFSEWLGDKVFLVLARTLFAAIFAIPLTYLDDWWFIVIGALAIVSLISRFHLWASLGGSGSRYFYAILAAFYTFVIYADMVSISQVDENTWTKWREFLPPVSESE